MPLTKAQLRDEIRRRLRAMSPEQRTAASARVRERVLALPAWGPAKTIFGFLPMTVEVQLLPLLERAWAEGKAVLVPKIGDDNVMRALPLAAAGDARPGRFGLLEPPAGEAPPAASIDLVLTPGLAFDVHGGRLGRGAGFYDRFFADPSLRAIRCAVAYDCQRVEAVPMSDADARVDLLVTETGVWNCIAPAPRTLTPDP